MKITIYQGNDHLLPPSDITIVIDVIRAFTVAHIAFMKGVNKILLVGTVEEALQLKKEYPEYLLAGEVGGLPIAGFDLDNSPFRIHSANIEGKTLVQKTTNGVKATLHSLQAKELYVTGFSNARTTALFIKSLVEKAGLDQTIHIVASHPTGDDDLACALYIKGIMEGKENIAVNDVRERIRHSHVAAKFFDPLQSDFIPEDIAFCLREIPCSFVMKVNKIGELPMIERFPNE
jgi:2-phosphosulfolactate phosphatase